MTTVSGRSFTTGLRTGQVCDAEPRTAPNMTKDDEVSDAEPRTAPKMVMTDEVSDAEPRTAPNMVTDDVPWLPATAWMSRPGGTWFSGSAKTGGFVGLGTCSALPGATSSSSPRRPHGSWVAQRRRSPRNSGLRVGSRSEDALALPSQRGHFLMDAEMFPRGSENLKRSSNCWLSTAGF